MPGSSPGSAPRLCVDLSKSLPRPFPDGFPCLHVLKFTKDLGDLRGLRASGPWPRRLCREAVFTETRRLAPSCADGEMEARKWAEPSS